MNIFTRNRVLVGAVVLLAALNVAILGTIAFSRLRTNTPPAPSEESQQKHLRFIAKELNLTPQQEQQFHELREEYSDFSQENRAALGNKYRAIMSELSDPDPNRSLLDTLALEIGRLHVEQQKATINHFLTLREICSYEQYEQLQQLFMRMMSRQHEGRREQNMRRQRIMEKRGRENTAE